MLTTMKMMRSGSESFGNASNHHSKHCVATWAIFTDIFPQGLRQKCHCYIGKHNILLCFSLFCLFGHIFDAWRGQKHFPLASNCQTVVTTFKPNCTQFICNSQDIPALGWNFFVKSHLDQTKTKCKVTYIVYKNWWFGFREKLATLYRHLLF